MYVFAYCYTERKTEQPKKKETIYNTIYSKERKRVKSGQNRHKKEDYKNSPLIPGKRTLTTKAPKAY